MPRKTKEITTDKKEQVKKKETIKKETKKTNTSKQNASVSKKSNEKKTSSKTAKNNSTKKTTSKKAPSSKIISKKSTTKKSTTRKKKTTNKKEKIDVVEYYDLPYRYNQTVVKVLAQTPNNLFIYWDISDKDKEFYKKEYGESFFESTKPVLIIHNDTFNYSFEIDINDFANSWYLHVNDSKCDYRIELGRRPIISQNTNNDNQNKISEKLKNIDYIYISTSNEIEAPNDHILFNKNQQMVYFKNVKTGKVTEKNVTSNISFITNMGKIYNIYDLYKAIYKEENIEDFYDLSNPSSGNPTSRF